MIKSKRGSCIGLVLTIKQIWYFQNTGVTETGISNHHALIFSFLESTFTKMLPNALQYRNYKQFEAHPFLQDVGQLRENYPNWLYRMGKRFCENAKKYPPLKTKVIRGNHKPLSQKLEKDNYETTRFKKERKYLK